MNVSFLVWRMNVCIDSNRIASVWFYQMVEWTCSIVSNDHLVFSHLHVIWRGDEWWQKKKKNKSSFFYSIENTMFKCWSSVIFLNGNENNHLNSEQWTVCRRTSFFPFSSYSLSHFSFLILQKWKHIFSFSMYGYLQNHSETTKYLCSLFGFCLWDRYRTYTNAKNYIWNEFRQKNEMTKYNKNLFNLPLEWFQIWSKRKNEKNNIETSVHLKFRWIKSWNRKTSNHKLSMAKAKTKAKNYEMKSEKTCIIWYYYQMKCDVTVWLVVAYVYYYLLCTHLSPMSVTRNNNTRKKEHTNLSDWAS